MTPTHLGFDTYDVASQTWSPHHYWVADGQLETFSAPFRYVWPSELDLIRLAEHDPRDAERTNPERFASESRSHVLVWEKTG